MDIAVAVRLAPKAGDELEIDSSGTDIDWEYVDMRITDFDDQALEEAVLIKEATGATVTAVGLQAEGIEEALRVARARGADRLVVVDAGGLDPYDTRTAARAFAEAFRSLAPDLILIGVQTPVDVLGQTAPVVAVELGAPQVNCAVGVTVEGDRARVTQEYSGGRLAVLAVELPAVVGVQSASAPPRDLSMARLRQAMSDALVEPLAVAVTPAAGGPEVVALSRPAAQSHATMLEGDAASIAGQILAVLQEKGALVS
jgi:electron transfer flavoprotein beta subunit